MVMATLSLLLSLTSLKGMAASYQREPAAPALPWRESLSTPSLPHIGLKWSPCAAWSASRVDRQLTKRANTEWTAPWDHATCYPWS